MITRDCRVCGGDGWLESLPEGQSQCPYCKGTGKEPMPKPKPKEKDEPKS